MNFLATATERISCSYSTPPPHYLTNILLVGLFFLLSFMRVRTTTTGNCFDYAHYKLEHACSPVRFIMLKYCFFRMVKVEPVVFKNDQSQNSLH